MNNIVDLLNILYSNWKSSTLKIIAFLTNMVINYDTMGKIFESMANHIVQQHISLGRIIFFAKQCLTAAYCIEFLDLNLDICSLFPWK